MNTIVPCTFPSKGVEHFHHGNRGTSSLNVLHFAIASELDSSDQLVSLVSLST